MTQFSDGLRAGGVSYPPAASGNLGVPLDYDPVQNIVPARSFSNTLATVQTVSGAAFTLTAGSGITRTSVNGTAVYAFDVPRNILMTGNVSTVTAVNMNVVGFDYYGQSQTETFSGPTGTGTASTSKTYAAVVSITAAGDTTSAIAIGQGDRIGFAYAVADAGYVLISYSGNLITTSANIALADTATATAFTGDVRGAYTLPSASDGAKRLVVRYTIPSPNSKSLTYGVTPA